MFAKMTRLQRFAIGFVLVLAVLIIGFFIVQNAANTWGATPAEISRPMPGDELAPSPLVLWDNAVTIHAPLEKVWPWIIQMGDTRAGFYSYMFIEKAVMRLMGPDPDLYYNNADRIHPEWQNPKVGTGMIVDMLKVRAIEPFHFLLGVAQETGLAWTWVWNVEPVDAQNTRLHVRVRIQVPPEANNPIVAFIFGAGGFIMEQNMIQGIQQRAEGASEPANIEVIEIGLWLAILAAGVACAVAFLSRRASGLALAVGLLAVVALFVITFVQPEIWMRAALALVLWVGTFFSLRNQPAL